MDAEFLPKKSLSKVDVVPMPKNMDLDSVPNPTALPAAAVARRVETYGAKEKKKRRREVEKKEKNKRARKKPKRTTISWSKQFTLRPQSITSSTGWSQGFFREILHKKIFLTNKSVLGDNKMVICRIETRFGICCCSITWYYYYYYYYYYY